MDCEIFAIYESNMENKYEEYRKVLKRYKKKKRCWIRKKFYWRCIPLLGAAIVAISNLIKS